MASRPYRSAIAPLGPWDRSTARRRLFGVLFSALGTSQICDEKELSAPSLSGAVLDKRTIRRTKLGAACHVDN
jgi:hypothetical protein